MVSDARVVESVRAYAKLCMSVSKQETLLRGNVDVCSTSEVEVCCTVACARVVKFVQAYAKVSIVSCNKTCRIDIWSIDD
jgi:hypothetical protein